jgi:hypothetical protein
MEYFPTEFQVISDLHLETRLGRPSYTSFKLALHARHLCLLGNIGRVNDEGDDGLFYFLEELLKSNPNLRIFYVFGNHEAYQRRLASARKVMMRFEKNMNKCYGDRFHFMHRTRLSINQNITVLGCTLWTDVPPEQASAVTEQLTDFRGANGIQDWTLDSHLREHCTDLAWLNEQVAQIQRDDPSQRIVILTHHSPTMDPRAIDPMDANNPLKSGFVTDLSSEVCWTSKSVKMWAFGHTHQDCAFHEEESKKLVISNQKGYASPFASALSKINAVVVEASGEEWPFRSIVKGPGRTARRPKRQRLIPPFTSPYVTVKVTELPSTKIGGRLHYTIFKRLSGFFLRPFLRET